MSILTDLRDKLGFKVQPGDIVFRAKNKSKSYTTQFLIAFDMPGKGIRLFEIEGGYARSDTAVRQLPSVAKLGGRNSFVIISDRHYKELLSRYPARINSMIQLAEEMGAVTGVVDEKELPEI